MPTALAQIDEESMVGENEINNKPLVAIRYRAVKYVSEDETSIFGTEGKTAMKKGTGD